MSTPENPPAFPHPLCSYGGLTMRDWFAGHALSGLVSDPTLMQASGGAAEKLNISVNQAVAQQCYEYADAMLAQRIK